MRALIIYASTHGQTKKIAERIGDALSQAQWVVQLESIEKRSLLLKDFDLIILGSRIRYGKHDKRLTRFMQANIFILKNKTTAFFSVNLVARKSEKSSPDTNPYVIKLLKSLTWTPNVLAVFAGKLNYPVYGFFDKKIIQLIMKMTKGPVGAAGTYEFTDWSAVDYFAKKIIDKNKMPH